MHDHDSFPTRRSSDLEGAKSDARRKVKEGGEREMRQLRDRAQRELDRLDEIWSTFTKLETKQLIADELQGSSLVKVLQIRSEEHTSELQSPDQLVCRR